MDQTTNRVAVRFRMHVNPMGDILVICVDCDPCKEVAFASFIHVNNWVERHCFNHHIDVEDI